MVWDLGRRPRTPLRTGKGGKGWGNRYDVCIDEEELAEERRVVREVEVEDTGARSAPGRVTGTDRPMMWCYSILLSLFNCTALWKDLKIRKGGFKLNEWELFLRQIRLFSII